MADTKTLPIGALQAAVQEGDATRAANLLRKAPELVNVVDADGWTPLHIASHAGQNEIAALLLAHGASVQARSSNDMRNTPLHAALAGRASDALVGLLLAHEADVNAVAAGGVTPLHLAASRGRLDVVKQLLAAGSVSQPMDDGQRPADIARERGHPDTAEYLDKQDRR